MVNNFIKFLVVAFFHGISLFSLVLVPNILFVRLLVLGLITCGAISWYLLWMDE